MGLNNSQITVDIDSVGNVTVRVNGEKGAGCEALTKAIEESLGEATSNERTAEYHEKPQRSTAANVTKHRA